MKALKFKFNNYALYASIPFFVKKNKIIEKLLPGPGVNRGIAPRYGELLFSKSEQEGLFYFIIISHFYNKLLFGPIKEINYINEDEESSLNNLVGLDATFVLGNYETEVKKITDFIKTLVLVNGSVTKQDITRLKGAYFWFFKNDSVG